MRVRVTTALTALAAAVLFGLPAMALEAPAPAPAAAAKPMKTFKVLTPEQVDPGRILPPPPADGSDVQLAELAEIRRLYAARTPERLAKAQWDDVHEDSMVFAGVLGPRFDLTRLPRTAELLALVENEGSVAATLGKRHFLRNRPWAIDPSLKACDYKPNANPKTSYPSGHAMLGFSVGYVLANLIPEKSDVILARAAEYGYSRQICAAHYASDVEASHVLATVVAMELMSDPRVVPMMTAARAELKAAGLGAPAAP